MAERNAPNAFGWLIGVLAVAALALVVTNIFLHGRNLELQEQLAQRQQFINEGIRLSRFNGQFVQTLAVVAAQTEDAAITDMLANHGITFTVNLPEEAAIDE